MADRYDVIIIGTGAGGGTLAAKLAPSGKKILVLERGEVVPRERENWDPHEVATRGRYRTTEQWDDSEGKPFHPYTHYCVGGNTKAYGAALLRLRASDFEEHATYDGMSPAWPISYADLNPYYTEAEWMYHVHGERGSDPCEPPSTDPYRYAPLDHEPRIANLAERFRRVGAHPFPLPIGVRLPQDASPTLAPVRLALFDGYPDPTESKADSHVVGVVPALQHANVSMRTGCFVERLVTNASGHEVTGVLVRTPLGVEEIRSHIVVASCGAIQSAALLLRSANDRHPHGLANGSGLVGRNYMAHVNGALVVYSNDTNDAVFQKTFGITDYYHRSDSDEMPLGSIQLMGRTDLDGLRSLFAESLPNHSIEDLAAHTVEFWLTAEDLPRHDNRVTWTRDNRIRLYRQHSNQRAYDGLRAALCTLLERAEPRGAQVYSGYQLGLSGVSHQNGTLRFGRDPRTSVLDVFCRAHDLDNLYVVDASFFPSCGAVNPSLTIMANALRVGEHLLDRIGG